MSKYPGRIVSNLAPAGYSVAFDGTGDFLTSSHPALNATFTIEAWVYRTSGSANQSIVFLNSGGVSGVVVYIDGSNFLVCTDGVNAQAAFSNLTVPINAWAHVAVVRSGGTTTGYVNGTVAGSHTFTPAAVNAATIARYSAASPLFFPGYISNVRVVNGTAVYTAAFTPPTQLFNITNTSLLTCNSPAIVDQSNNAFAITANGNSAVSTFTPFTAYVPYNPALGASTPGVWTLDEALQAAGTRQWNMYDPSFNLTTLLLHGNPTNGTSFITDASTNNFTVTPVADARAANLSPFSLTTFATSGSGYLDGTGDYFTVASNAALGFGTGDFTVEFWINLPSASTTQVFFDNRNLGTGIVIYSNAGTLTVNFNNSGGVLITGGALTSNTWTHIALSRISGSTRLFINGTQSGSTASDTNNYPTNATYIGGNFSAGQLTTGYISNVRIVKGVAVYTGNFTTPTAPLTATQAAGTNISAITGTQTSLLTLQNSQSANNNAFLDSSSNNFLITRNPASGPNAPTQGSFSPFSAQPGAWSSYYSGVADTNGTYFAANAAYSFGTGDFTVEAWINIPPISNTNGKAIVDSRPSGFNGSYWFFGFTNTGQLTGITMTTGGTTITSTSAIPTNQWVHVAYTRASGTLNLWVNGVSVASATGNTNNISSDTLWVGRNAFSGVASDTWFSGYMSNLRIVKGVAVYTGTFTPPASPLEKTQSAGINIAAITGSQTSLLFNQSNRFVDNSNTNATPLTLNTWPTIQPFSPFYPTAAYTPQTIGGSGYFDGTGDYLSMTIGSSTIGAGDFTIELWYYPTAFQNFDTLFSTTRGANGFNIGTNASASVVWYSSSAEQINSGVLRQNAWNHIAFTRTSNTLRLYLNGSQTGATPTVSTNFSATTCWVGDLATSGTEPAQGYISGLRVVTQSLASGSTYTVPTAPPTAIANTSLLLNFTNAGVVDSTGDNVLETVGNAQISTTQSKFGGSSMYFDGTGDYLLAPSSQNFAFPSDFTVEFWSYITAVSGEGTTFYVNATGGINIFLSISGNWGIARSFTAVDNNFGTPPTQNTWNHLAVSRAGSTIRAFINGVQVFSGTNTISYVVGPMQFGLSAFGSITGYIDELRVTKFARYTGNFTPQTSQWQDQ